MYVCIDLPSSRETLSYTFSGAPCCLVFRTCLNYAPIIAAQPQPLLAVVADVLLGPRRESHDGLECRDQCHSIS